MKRTFFISILIVFFIIPFMSIVGCNNQTSKEQYELQDKCGKRSEEWVKKEYDGMKYSYKNHYNKKLNKCFILVFQNDGVSNEILFDVNDNNKIGGFSNFNDGKVFCSMLGKECKSKEEWDKLKKAYIEE